MSFLPISKQDMAARGWDAPDFVFVTGDAYVDHPTFGCAILTRLLESQGFRMAILAQPRFEDCSDFKRFGRPKYGFLISGGNIDSMVAHYTAARRRRSDDAYSPGNQPGLRPDRATIVYCRLAREAYGDIPIVIGGLEASLRRFAHYDYWDDAVRPSILTESGADLLSFGMGEHSITEICRRLAAGESPKTITDVRGTCHLAALCDPLPEDAVMCASFDKVSQDKKTYARACRLQLEEQDHVYGKPIVQKHGEHYLVQNRPALPLSTEELDCVAELPYERYYHPIYEKMGGVPAIKEVEFSITHNRGCFGACNFCSIAFHQGRYVTVRSHESILREAESFTHNPHFKGIIHDVGGPTANFRAPACSKQETCGVCKGKKCLAPTMCPAVKVDHRDYIALLRELRAIPGVRKVFVRSGLRFDYMMGEEDETFLREIIENHISGYLKVAPEHCSPRVLDEMGKPHIGVYEKFQKRFYDITKRLGKEQYLIPYLMSSHPGSTMKDAVELALFLKKHHLRPQQVQDYYPTPGTASTCMFYTGIDPWTMQAVYVPTDPYEKKLQRTLLQYWKPENRGLVIEALIRAGREDLIGHGPEYLVQPDQEYLRTHRPSAPDSRSAGKETHSGKTAARQNSRTGAARSGKPTVRPEGAYKGKEKFAPKGKPKKGR